MHTHTHIPTHTYTLNNPTQTLVSTNSQVCLSLCSCEESEPVTKQGVWGLIYRMDRRKRGPRMEGRKEGKKGGRERGRMEGRKERREGEKEEGWKEGREGGVKLGAPISRSSKPMPAGPLL